MKKFFKNLIIYLIFFIIISNLFALIITNIPTFSKIMDFGPEVFVAVVNSRKRISYEKIILGDSVAHQIFKNYKGIKDNFYDLTTNQAVSMAGHYILIMNAINIKDNNIKEIDLVYHPRSFSNDLDQIWTFDYFVKPFLSFSNKKYFSENVLNKLKKIKLYNIAILPIVKIIPNFPSLDYSKFLSNSSENRSFLSGISIEYLQKIKMECEKKNIKFRVISCPIRRSSIDNYDLLKRQIADNCLEDIFVNYFEKMVIYEDTDFIDDFHLKKDYILSNREAIISNLIN